MAVFPWKTIDVIKCKYKYVFILTYINILKLEFARKRELRFLLLHRMCFSVCNFTILNVVLQVATF